MIGSAPSLAGTLPPRPAMRGRYLVRSDKAFSFLSLLDAALSPMRSAVEPVPRDPSRIVVANGAHLGDVLLTLPAVAALRQAFPKARIGMIVGSWGKPVAEWSGLLDEIHVFDHWMHNRNPRGRMLRHRATRADTLRALRECRYELGIDFYPFFPPVHPLFFRARIPVRIGFESGGFGPLLTHPTAWRNADIPFTEHLRDLLVRVNCAPPAGTALRYHRPAPGEIRAPLRSGDYVVLHPGSGAPSKDWGLDNWHEVAACLRARGETIVLTGAGAQEREAARRLEGLVDCNFVDALDWKEFADVVASAKAVICPDTAAGHLAAVFDVPTVAIFTGTNNLHQWAPYSPRAITVLTSVACAPCYRRGCETMPCIRGTSPGKVLDALDAVLARQ